MIIKFEVNGAWQMYDDIDSLMYRKLEAHAVAGDLEDPMQTIDFTKTMSEGQGKKENPGRILLAFMNSKQTNNYQVVAFSPIYLMNNQGRTVEII